MIFDIVPPNRLYVLILYTIMYHDVCTVDDKSLNCEKIETDQCVNNRQ